jgi:glycosyltransferase involved in cell wall biosynthesis
MPESTHIPMPDQTTNRVRQDDPRPTVIFVHQGGELYGSDRVFVQIVRAASSVVRPIVVLCSDGPLRPLLERYTYRIVIRDLGVIRRKHASIPGVFRVGARLLRGIYFLRRVAAADNAVGVYTNTLAVIGGALASRRRRLVHLWHVHEFIVSPEWLLRFYRWCVPAWSDTIVCNSRAVHDHLLPENRTRRHVETCIIHNTVDIERFSRTGDRARFRRQLGVSDDLFVVSVIGRVHFWKGQILGVRAVRLLRERGVPAVLCVAGDAFDVSYHDALGEVKAEAANTGMQDWVRYPGFVNETEDLYAASDVLAVPSVLPEPFGLVIIEAMLCGCPVVASAHGGAVEIIEDGENGLLFPPGDAAALAKCLHRLAVDLGLRRKVIEGGQETARSKFSEKRFAAQVQNVLRRSFGQLEVE